ncbi:hypothetical protein HYV22_03645 [Candidatus Gottesmanbacteria bacterium]|nr:hypothetical protein [Candidatus Gottesmanbacteria bacterium]
MIGQSMAGEKTMARYEAVFVNERIAIEFRKQGEYDVMLYDSSSHAFGGIKGGFTDWEVFNLDHHFDPKRPWLGLGMVKIPGPFSTDTKSGEAFVHPRSYLEEVLLGRVQGSTMFSGGNDVGYMLLVAWDEHDETSVPEENFLKQKSAIQDRQMVIAGCAAMILHYCSPKAPPKSKGGFLGLFRR